MNNKHYLHKPTLTYKQAVDKYVKVIKQENDDITNPTYIYQMSAIAGAKVIACLFDIDEMTVISNLTYRFNHPF